jgi:hypothetical protein
MTIQGGLNISKQVGICISFNHEIEALDAKGHKV